ncbi:putative ribonuclease H-like domain-containing protein, partial [Tanacetum coccineum]
TEDIFDAGDYEKEAESVQDYFVRPIWSPYSSTVKRSTIKDAGEAPNKHPDLKTDEKPVDKEDQVFLDELERLKRQEQDANDAADALRKKFAQETKDFLLQARAAKTSSTNIVNTSSTPVSTASPYGGLSFTDLTNPDQDDSEIPALEEIYNNPTDDPQSAVQTRSKVTKSYGAHAFVDAMQEELLQFKIQKVWILVDLPYGKKAIGTKWVYRNKKDERGVVVKNKARYIMCLTTGFLDPKYPQKVYKVVKALYGLHQAPRAWYATLFTFLLKNGYRRGTIDKTLFIKKDKHDIILVQVYVDDIIFGSTKKSWCGKFEALMKSRFQMSSMRELTFFIGLQVKQKADGIFISQDKYVAEILKKFDFVNIKTASTPIETQKPLVKDEEASDVDVHLYRSMIGSLVYLTASRPDIMFAVCPCSRFSLWVVFFCDDKYHKLHEFNWEGKFDGCTVCLKCSWVQKHFNHKGCISRSSLRFRESLRGVFDGTEALMLPILFILWLEIVSNDSAELVPMGKKGPSEAEPHTFSPLTCEAPGLSHSLTSPRPSPSATIPDSIPESSGGNHGGHSSSDKSLLGNEGEMTLQSVYDLCISLCTQIIGLDLLETEDSKMWGKARDFTNKEKVSFDRPIVSTDGSKVSTDKEKDSTGRIDEGTDGQTKGGKAIQATQTTRIPTSTIFGDDETIARVLLNMSQAKAVLREKEKGVEFKDVEETGRPRPTSTRSLLTLKPLPNILPKIDPKDKGKNKIEEEDAVWKVGI